MILNSSIYERAVSLFDDPTILGLYNSNTIQFQKTMYPFLVSGVSIVTDPPVVTNLLVECEEPKGVTETVEGTGDKTYTLDSEPIEGATFIYWNNGVVDEGASFDASSNSVTFSEEVETDTEATIEWYYAGAFTGDITAKVKNFSAQAMNNRIIDLLSRALMLEWAKKQTNTLVDGITNLLTDTDFKLHSPSNSLKAKTEWVKALSWEFYTLQTKLSADLINTNIGGYGFW